MNAVKTILDLLRLTQTSVALALAPAAAPARLAELLGELEALAGDLGIGDSPAAADAAPLAWRDVEHQRAQERAALEASRAAAARESRK